MSDSEDDRPLKAKAKSKDVISKAEDAAMDKQIPTNGHVNPGISIAMGPVADMDVDKPITNGHTNDITNGKRKVSLANGKSYKDDSDSDDDVPLQKKRKTDTVSSDDEIPLKKVVKPPKVTAAMVGEESDDDVPIGQKLQQEKEKIEKKAAKEAKALRRKDKTEDAKRNIKKQADSDEDDDKPLIKKQKTALVKKEAKPIKKEESDDDVPLRTKAPAKKVKKEVVSPVKKGKTTGKVKQEDKSADDEEAEDEEEEYRWWEDQVKGDGTVKWNTLEHNGVVFPPEYEPLPKHVKMLYDKTPVTMKPDAEEIAYAFGSMLISAHNVENPTFRKNFFADFKDMLDETGHAKDKDGNTIKIKQLEKCDFQPIFDHVDAERSAKKALPAADKKKLKAEKDEKEAAFMYCMWDGRKQKVGNFRVEPPGLFRGRGEHPKTGKFKKRVTPEQITINIGKEAMVPKPPDGHSWKEVKHDKEGTWLAMWQENINGAYKYVMLAANSDIKGKSDFKKFEKARELK
ncbi:DNA topoisomerase 1, partial [Friedmanniomyces endolithicus]